MRSHTAWALAGLVTLVGAGCSQADPAPEGGRPSRRGAGQDNSVRRVREEFLGRTELHLDRRVARGHRRRATRA